MNDHGLVHVLVVDDSEFFVQITAETLGTEHEISTETAKTGEEALSIVREGRVDCVVSDYEMPEMNGLELYRRIDEEFDVPFVLLTAQGGEMIASEAIGAGVDDYLQKNQIIEEDRLKLLANRIHNVVSQHRARRKYAQLLDNTPDEIVEVSTDGKILAANESMARGHGTTREALIGEQLSDVLDPAVAANRLEHGRRAVTAGSAVTFQDDVGVRYFHNIVTPLTSTADGDTVQFITRDITQQKRQERQLETRSEELALINRLVRHDINNDVQLLMGWGAALSDHVDDEEGSEYVERIQDTCDHIAELTANVGEFVDSLLGGDDVTLREIELRTVVSSEMTKKEAAFDEAEFRVEGQLPDVSVRANEALQSVFGNLFANAVRHNDAPVPRVTVDADVTDTDVRITVADNGPGVPEGLEDDIFGRGEMGPESGGTGIGLYLVATLVEHYGGSVAVGDADAGGAAFTVELPIAGAE